MEVKNVLASVTAFIEGTPSVTPEDRDVLRTEWKPNDTPLVVPSKSHRTSRRLRAARYGVRLTSIISRLIKVSERLSTILAIKLTFGLELEL